MWRSNNWREEAPALLKLAGPLIVNNLAIAGMQFADAVMAGRLGAESVLRFRPVPWCPHGYLTDCGAPLRRG